MHAEVRQALEEAIREALGIIHPELHGELEPCVQWRAIVGGNYQGVIVPRLGPIPELNGLIDAVPAGKRFGSALASHHPDQIGMVRAFDSTHFLDPRAIFVALLREILDRAIPGSNIPRREALVSSPHVSAVANEYAAFISTSTFKLRFVAPLVNAQLGARIRSIALPHAITMRRPSDAELTTLYGGPVRYLAFWSAPMAGIGLTPTVLSGEITASSHPGKSETLEPLLSRLNRLILALRTFKANPVGYSGVSLTPATFVPVALGNRFQGGPDYVPGGTYLIERREATALLRHTARHSRNQKG